MSDRKPDAFSMILSAAIFGFFGFIHLSPQQINTPMTAVVWTLRIGAAAFALCALLALLGRRESEALYQIAGGLTVIAFLVLGLWLLLGPGLGWQTGVLLLIFALWNASELGRSLLRRPRF